MNTLRLTLDATPLDFDPIGGDEASYGQGIQGHVPATHGAPVRFDARFDPRSGSVVVRVGEARARGCTVPLAAFVEAFLRASGAVADHRPDYAAALHRPRA